MNEATLKAIADLDKQPGESGALLIPNHARPTTEEMEGISAALYERGYLVITVQWSRRDCLSVIVRRMNAEQDIRTGQNLL